MANIRERYEREKSLIAGIVSTSGMKISVTDDLMEVQSLLHRWRITADGKSLLVYHNNYGRKKKESPDDGDAVFPGFHRQRRCYCLLDAFLGIANHDDYFLRYPELRAARYPKHSKEWAKARRKDEARLAAYTRLLIETESRKQHTAVFA